MIHSTSVGFLELRRNGREGEKEDKPHFVHSSPHSSFSFHSALPRCCDSSFKETGPTRASLPISQPTHNAKRLTCPAAVRAPFRPIDTIIGPKDQQRDSSSPMLPRTLNSSFTASPGFSIILFETVTFVIHCSFNAERRARADPPPLSMSQENKKRSCRSIGGENDRWRGP